MTEAIRYALFSLGAAGLFTGVIAALPAPRAEAPAGGVSIVRKDPRFDALFPKDAVVEKLADGYAWTEGPVWDKAKARLLFSDIPGTGSSRGRRGRGPRSS